MADQDSSDDLDDLRKKRLAYFQASNIDSETHKVAVDSSAPNQHPNSSNTTAFVNFASKHKAYKGDYGETIVGVTVTSEKNQHASITTASNREYTDSQDNAQTCSLSNFDTPIESFKDTSLFNLENAHSRHNSKEEDNFIALPSVVSDIIDEKKTNIIAVPTYPNSSQAEKVLLQQDMDGYNETVERLIRATKEELLGKKASDDIWKQFVKDLENDIPKETNEGTYSCVESKEAHGHLKRTVLSEVFPNNGNEIRSQDQFENTNGIGIFPKANTEDTTIYDTRKPPIKDSEYMAKSPPAKSTGLLEPSTSKKVSRWSETNHHSYDSEKVEAIFSSRQIPWSKPSNSYIELKDSQDFDMTVEKKVNESLNLSDLGLSTHRPESDSNRESVQASDLNLGDTITIELRTVLGEEKFQQFLCKAKRELDDLHENRSDRSVRKDKTPRLIKESSSNVKLDKPTLNDTNASTIGNENKAKKLLRQVSEPSGHSKSIEHTQIKTRRQISSADARKRLNDPATDSKDFKPRLSDGDAITDIIEKHIFGDKEKDAGELSERTIKSTERQLVLEQESMDVAKVVIPELNLSEMNKSESPRPKLNRPKHEPFIIYPDKSKSNSYSQQESPKSDIRKNYEQIPVAKTVVFSADEIYSQAYGSLYQSQPQFHAVMANLSGHQHHGTRQYITQSQGPSTVTSHSFTVPLTPTTPVFSGSHGAQPFTPVTPRQTQPYPIQTANHIDELARFQQCMSSSIQMQAQPVVQVPRPPTQPYQTHQIQGNQGFLYDFPYTQNFGTNANVMANQLSSGSPPNFHAFHTPHPPIIPEDFHHPTLNMVSASHPQGMVSSGYSMMNTSPPSMVPHPSVIELNRMNHNENYVKPAAGTPPTPKTSNAEVQTENAEPRDNDKVTIVEESTFTSVSQIPDNDVMLPHPPTSKKNSKPSPRKIIKGQDPKRHIDGVRQHHEQRRHEQEEAKLTDEEILARQRKFAKASLDRYFASLENLYVASKTGKPGHLEDTIESNDEEGDSMEREETEVLKPSIKFKNELLKESDKHTPEVLKADKEFSSEVLTENSEFTNEMLKAKTKDSLREAVLDEESDIGNKDISKPVETSNTFDEQTVVNSEVTSVTVNAGGVTERLEELGVHVSHSGENILHGDKNNNTSGNKKQIKRGKKLLVCPECQGLNKEYMSWCTHCGEMIIGVEPKLVSKTRDGKLRIKPVDYKDNIVTKLNNINTNTQLAEVNYIQEIPDKPFSLNLEELKIDDRESQVDSKNVSPIKSDGKDSGRPSSEDKDSDLPGPTADDDVDHYTQGGSIIQNARPTADDDVDHYTQGGSIIQNATKSHISTTGEKQLSGDQLKESNATDEFQHLSNTSDPELHIRNNQKTSLSLSEGQHLKQLSDEKSNNMSLKKELDHFGQQKIAQEITDLNNRHKESDQEMISVADRVKRIESEREIQLKNNCVTNTAQSRNTQMFTGDLAMDSIGASYLVMSKKHELLQSQLHIHDEKSNSKRESERNSQLRSKESHTSVFELTADKTKVINVLNTSGVSSSTCKTSHGIDRDSTLEEHLFKLESAENWNSSLQSKVHDSCKVDQVHGAVNQSDNLSNNNASNKVLKDYNNDKSLGIHSTETASKPKVFHDQFSEKNVVQKQLKDLCKTGLKGNETIHKSEMQVQKSLSSSVHALENKVNENRIDFKTKVSASVDKSDQDIPPPLPQFSAHAPESHNELALKLPANSMDFSMDYSHVGSLSYEALDEFKTEEEIKAIKEEKKKERRRKRGHGAIDVEVFGIEEMRESRNSSRGQRLVPVLNLAGNSSDEDDFSIQSDTKSDFKPDGFVEPALQNYNVTASTSAWEPDCTPELPHFEIAKSPDLEVSKSPDTSARPIDEPSTSAVNEQPKYNTVSSTNEDRQLLFDPQLAEETEQLEQEDYDDTEDVDLDQPFLEQVLKHGQKPVKSKTRPTSAKSKSVKSKVRQSWEGQGYQRKWARSSSAWSSYNIGELNTSSSLRSSTESQRPASAPKCRNLTSSKDVSSRDTSPLSHKGRSNKRPFSADMNKRSSNAASGNQQANPEYNMTADSSEKKEGLSIRLNPDIDNPGNTPVNEVPERPPYILWLDKDKKSNSAGQRPSSANKSKGKQPKQKKKAGSHGNDLDLSVDLVTIEHRLPKPGVLEWLSDLISATSPKSTYDKYLEMTPRIEAGTISKWQCLPDEILLHVFAYLDQTSLTKCAQVCHQFYRVAMDESLWKYITIKKRHDIDDNCLTEIAKRHPLSLALIQCQGEQVTAKGLRDLFRECSPNLKELNISRCSKGALQGDSLLLHAAARCNHVTHIDASWCNVTDSGLMAISNTVDRLESLCINGCHAISDDGLETIIKKHGNHLRVLEMFGCFNITPRGLRCISNNCINLISINLGNCYKLTDSCIAQLSASLGRAESVDLRGCKQIKDNCIRRVVKNCPRLKHLSLANCPNITDVSLLEISTYLTDIRSIDLCGCKKVTDNSIRALVNTCTNLRDIDISSTGCTHRSVSMIANFSGQRLETLKINFLSDVTEQSLIKLAKHCRRLQSVHMYGCPSVRNMSKIQEERPTFTINM